MGSLGIPATRDAPLRRGLRAQGPGAAGGGRKQVLAAGGPVARAMRSESPRTRRCEWLLRRPSAQHVRRRALEAPQISRAAGPGRPLCLDLSSQQTRRASEVRAEEAEGASFLPASSIPILPSPRSPENLPLAVPQPAGGDTGHPPGARGPGREAPDGCTAKRDRAETASCTHSLPGPTCLGPGTWGPLGSRCAGKRVWSGGSWGPSSP